jgi:hypothetical protein
MGAEQFGTSLHHLWLAANRDLPKIADRYASANQIIAGSSDDQGAFGRRAVVSHTSSIKSETTVTSPIFSHWDGLRDALQQALAQSTEYTFESAEALLRIMSNYASTDAEAAQALRANIASSREDTAGGASGQSGNQREKVPDYDFSRRPHGTGRQ